MLFQTKDTGLETKSQVPERNQVKKSFMFNVLPNLFIAKSVHGYESESKYFFKCCQARGPLSQQVQFCDSSD